MNLSENELFNIVFNRSIQPGLIKESQVRAARRSWIDSFINSDFLDKVKDNEDGDYDNFILNYIKPIWSWGVLYNNFNYISFQITDKGMIQLLSEGTAILNRESVQETKLEIKNTIFNLLKDLEDYCLGEKEDENELFEDFTNLKLKPQIPIFIGGQKRNKIRY